LKQALGWAACELLESNGYYPGGGIGLILLIVLILLLMGRI